MFAYITTLHGNHVSFTNVHSYSEEKALGAVHILRRHKIGHFRPPPPSVDNRRHFLDPPPSLPFVDVDTTKN